MENRRTAYVFPDEIFLRQIKTAMLEAARSRAKGCDCDQHPVLGLVAAIITASHSLPGECVGRLQGKHKIWIEYVEYVVRRTHSKPFCHEYVFAVAAGKTTLSCMLCMKMYVVRTVCVPLSILVILVATG